MKERVGQICKVACGHMRNIAKIRPCLNTPTAAKFILGFVSIKLDYLNSLWLLFGLPKWQLETLQRVQHAAATRVTETRKYDRITPVLYLIIIIIYLFVAI